MVSGFVSRAKWHVGGVFAVETCACQVIDPARGAVWMNDT
jgi:hypothetical protein